VDPLVVEYFVHALRNIIYTDLCLLQVKYKVKVKVATKILVEDMICGHKKIELKF
jgi:hypothetical protein